MSSLRLTPNIALSLAIAVVVLPCFAHAFGAGNIAGISTIEGQNWRHGDIEDTLLTLLMSRAAGGDKFTKLDVKRTYFGNWLRDYSQAVDVGTVKYVSAEAIRIILWVLGFLSFGYGTGEFEVTTERLGCYRPEEHIDNPRNYADNIDARQYDRRLRGPVDEEKELSIDPRNGMKCYIATEDRGITTSAGLIRRLFGKSIELGRKFARSENNADLYEALRLLGTGCHCLEDFSAHSNYTELALIEMGEKGVFPHVGSRTQIRLRGASQPVYPLITGTFGGVDFLHSVMGELSDKATQSEVQELEGTVAHNQNQENASLVKELLNSLPSGMLGSDDPAAQADELQANAAAQKMKKTHISPRQPEAWTKWLDSIVLEIRPILEFHDNVMQSITETMEKIPLLPEMLENLQDQINIFCFSLLAPYVLPIVSQVKTELATGSTEVIKSSEAEQHIVFNDDNSTDPTHSMLSKDHFSNILNEPAGKVASQVLKWAVPQIIKCWDDEHANVDATLDRIVAGVFHHPALRQQGADGASDGRKLMFSVVEKWWHEKSGQEQDVFRDKLSRDGVEQGRNHKEGVQDKGHGCGKPLGMPTIGTAQSSGAHGGPTGFAAQVSSGLESAASSAVGGGVVGGIVGGIVGSALEGGSEHPASGHGAGRGGRVGKGTPMVASPPAPPVQHGGHGGGAPPPQATHSSHGGGPPPPQAPHSSHAGPPPPAAHSAHGGGDPPPHAGRGGPPPPAAHSSHGGGDPAPHGSHGGGNEGKSGKSSHAGKIYEQSYGRDSDDEDSHDDDDDDYKRMKKESKRLEKEAKKMKKKDDKKYKKKHADSGDEDEDDDDDSGDSDSGKSHGSDKHKHSGKSSHKPGRGGEYESYQAGYEQPANQYQQGAHGGRIAGGGYPPRRSDYDEGLAYGAYTADRPSSYDPDLAYGESAEYGRHRPHGPPPQRYERRDDYDGSGSGGYDPRYQQQQPPPPPPQQNFYAAPQGYSPYGGQPPPPPPQQGGYYQQPPPPGYGGGYDPGYGGQGMPPPGGYQGQAPYGGPGGYGHQEQRDEYGQRRPEYGDGQYGQGYGYDNDGRYSGGYR